MGKDTSFHDGALAGVLLSPLKLAFALGMALMGILLVAWIIDWVFVSRVWPDGLDRLRSLLADDLGHGIMLAARQGRGTGEITGPANFLYGVAFEATGIHDMGLRFANEAALSIPDTVVRRSYLSNREAIEVAMVGTQLLGVRAAILARFAPLLLLVYVVGASDGFTRRAIRWACDRPHSVKSGAGAMPTSAFARSAKASATNSISQPPTAQVQENSLVFIA